MKISATTVIAQAITLETAAALKRIVGVDLVHPVIVADVEIPSLDRAPLVIAVGETLAIDVLLVETVAKAEIDVIEAAVGTDLLSVADAKKETAHQLEVITVVLQVSQIKSSTLSQNLLKMCRSQG
jgi:hypothetical protein